jgi:glycosyltransferase involved in cell wall biosynthesis
MKTSVILSTYNSPLWLEKVLWGYAAQIAKEFEVVIADDGSREETREMLERLRPELPFPLVHVWHPDEGFRKCAIMNKAIVAASGSYVIFSDGDCIPRRDFVLAHLKLRQRGRYLSGGYCKLPKEASHRIDRDAILSGKAFDPDYLAGMGLRKGWFSKHVAGGQWAEILNRMTPTRASWNGHNSSAFKDDLLAVNGFDERMVYGGEDRECGERLSRSGLKGRGVRYSAVCIHLDHPRGYVTREGIEFNHRIRAASRMMRSRWTNYGIRTGTEEEGMKVGPISQSLYRLKKVSGMGI